MPRHQPRQPTRPLRLLAMTPSLPRRRLSPTARRTKARPPAIRPTSLRRTRRRQRTLPPPTRPTRTATTCPARRSRCSPMTRSTCRPRRWRRSPSRPASPWSTSPRATPGRSWPRLASPPGSRWAMCCSASTTRSCSGALTAACSSPTSRPASPMWPTIRVGRRAPGHAHRLRRRVSQLLGRRLRRLAVPAVVARRPHRPGVCRHAGGAEPRDLLSGAGVPAGHHRPLRRRLGGLLGRAAATTGCRSPRAGRTPTTGSSPRAAATGRSWCRTPRARPRR